MSSILILIPSFDNKHMLELIDELILLVTHLKYYDGPNYDLINIETYWLLLWEVIIK